MKPTIGYPPDCIFAFLTPAVPADSDYLHSLAGAIKEGPPLHLFVVKSNSENVDIALRNIFSPQSLTLLNSSDDASMDRITEIICDHSVLRPLLMVFHPCLLALAELVYSPLRILGVPPSALDAVARLENGSSEQAALLERWALFAERQADLALLIGKSDRQFIQSELAFLGTSWSPVESPLSLLDTVDALVMANRSRRRLFPHKLELLTVVTADQQSRDAASTFCTEQLPSRSRHLISACAPWTSRESFLPARLYDAILIIGTPDGLSASSDATLAHLKSYAGYRILVINRIGAESARIKEIVRARMVHHVLIVPDGTDGSDVELDSDWKEFAAFCDLTILKYPASDMTEAFDELLSRRLCGRPNWQLHGLSMLMSSIPSPLDFGADFWQTTDPMHCLDELRSGEKVVIEMLARFDLTKNGQKINELKDRTNDLNQVIQSLEKKLSDLKLAKRNAERKRPSFLRRLLGRATLRAG